MSKSELVAATREFEAAVKTATVTKRQVGALMRKYKVPGKLSGSGSNWEVELPDERAKKLWDRTVGKEIPSGGYRAGYGGWVLRPGYQAKGDYNDPGSRWHYATDELGQAARDFEAALEGKTSAGFDGPYKRITSTLCQVWVAFESYGRVHHVTGDLTSAENLLDRYRDMLVKAQNMLGEKDIYFRNGVGDIHVDGLKGGRNKMIMDFFVTPYQGQWSEEQQAELDGLLRISEKAPPR